MEVPLVVLPAQLYGKEYPVGFLIYLFPANRWQCWLDCIASPSLPFFAGCQSFWQLLAAVSEHPLLITFSSISKEDGKDPN